MRKQTKIAAVVSAAALLAIGASMTSFAATGWQEENGTWVYYNKAGEQVTDSWEKSGDNWFYLDETGEMATDSLIEDDDDYYYVDANGAMVRNRWVAIDNEDAGEDDQPDVWWYYFQGNGKAYKNNHSTGNIFKKMIDGKTYCFNEDGKMQYGWVKKDEGTTNYDDGAFAECEYYFGDENDGAMTTGWREIALTDVVDAQEEQPGDSFWDEDQVRWFFFNSSGKKQDNKLNKTINGKKYGFDKQGRMIADWHAPDNTVDESLANESAEKSTRSDAVKNYAQSFMYFSSPEDGARFTRGWFKVVPGYYLNRGAYEDGSENWYYADGNGKLIAGQIKSIKGKKYAFDMKGAMLSGLKILKVNNNKIEEILGGSEYETEELFDKAVRRNTGFGVYFFSDNADHDGTMKTGIQKVSIDGEKFTFNFRKSGGNKGQGITGENNKKYYLGGKLLAADSDSKIELVKTGDGAGYEKMTITEYVATGFENMEVVAPTKKIGKASEGDIVYRPIGSNSYENLNIADVVVVNTAGSVVQSGTKKDADGFKVVVKNGKIQQIIAEN